MREFPTLKLGPVLILTWPPIPRWERKPGPEHRPAREVEWPLTPSLRVAAVTFVLIVLPANLSAQVLECASLPPAGPDSGYRLRGNRCEGLYRSPISSGEFELLSLTTGRLSFELVRGNEIVVRAPGGDDSVHVRAVGREARVYYRMDAVIAPGDSLCWPVDPVLLPEQLTAERIGVFGWRVMNGDTVFVPVAVGTTPEGSDRASMEMVVRPSFEADSVLWRIANDQGSKEWRSAARRLRAWQPVSVEVPPLSGSRAIVRFQAMHRRTGRWITFAVEIWRP